MVTSSDSRPYAFHRYADGIGGILLAGGAVLLTSIGGEAGGARALEWLAVLAGMTAVWLLSLSGRHATVPLVLGVAITIRLVFLAMPTGYDVYRYVWEGRALTAGFNPYLHPPDEPLLIPLRDTLWPKIGHPGATAIYPPFAQWIFALLASCGLGPFGFKLIFAGADILICWLLLRRFEPARARIYAWNPLAAVSFAGGGHYDSLFMLAMVAAWLAAEKKSESPPWSTALLLGAAVGLKWMAAPVALCLLFRQLRCGGIRPTVIAASLLAAPVLLSWLAISLWTGEWTLQLTPPEFSRVARSAELLPAIVDGMLGWQLDNRWFLGALVIAWAAVAFRSRDLLGACEWGFFATYVLSPMLHAWYFVWALPFVAASRNPGIIALAATGITYFHVHHTLSLPGGTWTFSWWERALIWLPFTVGFVLRRRSGRPDGSCGYPEPTGKAR